jgi:hypothetical protein
MDYLHHNEQIFTVVRPALISSANRVKRLLFEKEINRWLSNIVLLYSVDENKSLFSLTLFILLKMYIFWLCILLHEILILKKKKRLSVIDFTVKL